MNDKLVAVTIRTKLDEGVPAAKKLLLLLKERGMTYSRMLFPYVDNLILAKEKPQLAGTHILLDTRDIRMVKECAEKVCGKLAFSITEVECASSAIIKYFGEKCPRNKDSVAVGDITQLFGSIVTPWRIRECAGKMSSFAEHIHRIDGVDIMGFGDGKLYLRSMKPKKVLELAEIYENKTGTVMSVSKR